MLERTVEEVGLLCLRSPSQKSIRSQRSFKTSRTDQYADQVLTGTAVGQKLRSLF